MKTGCGVSLVLALFLWVGGCATTPEHLAATTQRDAYEASLEGGPNAPIGRPGTMDIAPVPTTDMGFAVLDFRAKRDVHGMVFVVGEVKNIGAATQGVELEVVLRDRDGRVVAVGNFCPAANHSIAPNSSQPFAYSLGKHESGVRAEIRIVRTFYTMDTLGIAALPR